MRAPDRGTGPGHHDDLLPEPDAVRRHGLGRVGGEYADHVGRGGEHRPVLEREQVLVLQLQPHEPHPTPRIGLHCDRAADSIVAGAALHVDDLALDQDDRLELIAQCADPAPVVRRRPADRHRTRHGAPDRRLPRVPRRHAVERDRADAPEARRDPAREPAGPGVVGLLDHHGAAAPVAQHDGARRDGSDAHRLLLQARERPSHAIRVGERKPCPRRPGDRQQPARPGDPAAHQRGHPSSTEPLNDRAELAALVAAPDPLLGDGGRAGQPAGHDAGVGGQVAECHQLDRPVLLHGPQRHLEAELRVAAATGPQQAASAGEIRQVRRVQLLVRACRH